MRHALYLIAVVTGAWALVSFSALMIVDGSGQFWTQSLMWSLLACAISVPVFFITQFRLPSSPKPEVSKSVEDVFGEDAKPFVQNADEAIEESQQNDEASPFEDRDSKKRQMA